MGERVRHSTSVSDHVQALVSSFKMFIHLDFHVVELDLNAVQKSIVIGGTRCDAVEGVDHLDDAVKDALGQYK